MSFRVGIILPQNIDIRTKKKLKNKYQIELLEFQHNLNVEQLKETEQVYQISSNGDDSDCGIGAYEICNRTLDDVYNNKLLTEKEKKMLVMDFFERKKNLEEDANKWVTIIKEIINEGKVERIGVFHFDGHYNNFENIKFIDFKVIQHHIKEICLKDIIEIGEKEIHFWNKDI